MQYDWRISAKKYLERLGYGEYLQQLDQHLRRGRKRSTFRYSPSEYHSDLIECLNRDSEVDFKSQKMLGGYASVLSV